MLLILFLLIYNYIYNIYTYDCLYYLYIYIYLIHFFIPQPSALTNGQTSEPQETSVPWGNSWDQKMSMGDLQDPELIGGTDSIYVWSIF